jgi:hypothetical protein
MIFQTNPKLGSVINHFGCYMCSQLYLVEKYSKIPMTVEGVMTIYNTAIKTVFDPKTKKMVIGDECFVNDAQSLLKLAGGKNLKALGTKPASYIPTKDEVEILCMYNPKTDFTHFVVGNGQSKVEFDPIGGGSRTAREGYVKSKRIFAIV